MYILLTGIPPFTGKDKETIFQNITRGQISHSGPIWNKISKDAVRLINRLLAHNPKMRISAEKALKDDWLNKFSDNKIEDDQFLTCMRNLVEFKENSAMKNAALSYMAMQIINKNKESKLKEVFNLLDRDNNGLLSLEELIEGYKILFNGDIEMAKKEADNTMRKIDVNGNCTIDYNGNK